MLPFLLPLEQQHIHRSKAPCLPQSRLTPSGLTHDTNLHPPLLPVSVRRQLLPTYPQRRRVHRMRGTANP